MGDNLGQKRTSRRFTPGRTTEKLVPILLVVLAIALVVTVVIVVLAVLGLMPVI